MVHSLSWSLSGRLLAAGLGDGTCMILRLDGKRVIENFRLKHHDACVACVHFPKFGCKTSKHKAAADRLLISAGNDGALFVWDLGTRAGGEGVMDPTTMLHDGLLCNLPPQRDDLKTEKVLFGIPHGEKPNWLVSSSSYCPTLPNSLFVADTTPDITAYILPQR